MRASSPFQLSKKGADLWKLKLVNLPVLALRGLTVFPHISLTFDVERRISMQALERGHGNRAGDLSGNPEGDQREQARPRQDLYTMGTISRITQILRLGQNSLRVMVEGGRRARLKRLWQTEPYLQGHVETAGGRASRPMPAAPERRPCCGRLRACFSDYAQLAGNVARGDPRRSDGLPGSRLAGRLDCPEHCPAV